MYILHMDTVNSAYTHNLKPGKCLQGWRGWWNASPGGCEREHGHRGPGRWVRRSWYRMYPEVGIEA